MENETSHSQRNNNFIVSKKDIKQEYDKSIEVNVKNEPCDYSEDENFLHIKKEPEIVSGVIEDYYKDHVIKKEPVINPEVIKTEDFTYQRSHKNIEIVNEDIKEIYQYQIIKEEHDEECVNQHLIKKETIDQNLKDLYKDHIIKDEVVIGPEILQKVPPIIIRRNVIEKRNTKKQYYCIKCNWFYLTAGGYKNHRCLYICDCCQIQFKNRYKIQQHLKKMCAANMSTKNSNKCHECGKTFSFPSNLSRHLMIHTGKKPYSCLQCCKSFARKDYLKFHIIKHHANSSPSPLHHDVPRAACDLCKKEFSKKHTRDHHMKYSCPKNKNREKFSRNKVYICDVCNKSYTYRSSLSAHIVRRHTKLRIGPLHRCDYCGKEYVKKHNLQCHIQWKHLNVKPYPCKKCKEKFKWHSTLAAHERKEHGRVRSKEL